MQKCYGNTPGVRLRTESVVKSAMSPAEIKALISYFTLSPHWHDADLNYFLRFDFFFKRKFVKGWVSVCVCVCLCVLETEMVRQRDRGFNRSWICYLCLKSGFRSSFNGSHFTAPQLRWGHREVLLSALGLPLCRAFPSPSLLVCSTSVCSSARLCRPVGWHLLYVIKKRKPRCRADVSWERTCR